MSRSIRFLSLVIALAASALGAGETAVPSLQVTPDRADWRYAPGEPVRFHVSLVGAPTPAGGLAVMYRVGPDTLPTEEYRDWVR